MFSRRMALRALAASAAGLSVSGWFSSFANQSHASSERKRNCILLWMAGGPSQTDTFDLKPNHENGGEFAEIATSVPGMRFSEHLPELAKLADKLAVVRGVSTKEGDHGRGTYLMRTGKQPLSPIKYPSIGASLASQQVASSPLSGLPPYVSVAATPAVNSDAFGPGFLGPRFSPLFVSGGGPGSGEEAGGGGFPALTVASLERIAGISDKRMQHRLELWRGLQDEFLERHAFGAPHTQNTVYDSALELMSGVGAEAFDLSQEAETLRAAYGSTVFGQGCLLARRLVERGVPFVEVSLGGWDTHQDNFNSVSRLSATLDAGWSTLMADLDDRGLLESTTILWMGEFGRTPRINNASGRDHFPAAWSIVCGGGGIRGGQVYGRTSDDGMRVVEDKVDVTDVLATLSAAVGVPPDVSHISNTGRPVPIVDGAPIADLLS